MKLWIGVVIIFVLIGGIFLALPKKDKKSEPTTVAGIQTENSFATIESAMNSGSPLIDVRTPEEFIAGHIKGAINLPLSDIQSGSFPATPKDKIVYVYCRSGNRSSQASKILNDAGYTHVSDLGAMTSVIAMGGVETR